MYSACAPAPMLSKTLAYSLALYILVWLAFLGMHVKHNFGSVCNVVPAIFSQLFMVIARPMAQQPNMNVNPMHAVASGFSGLLKWVAVYSASSPCTCHF